MKSFRYYFLVLSSLVFYPILTLSEVQAQDNLKLWYDKPAKIWNEALPLGNGRLGAMVFGDPAREKIQLNEETFWSGGPSRNDNANAINSIAEVRQLIFEGKLTDAENIVNRDFKALELNGSMFQVIGNLELAFPESHRNYSEYYRELNLNDAKYTSTYTVEDVIFKREVFASIPDQVIVVKLSASQQGKLTFYAGMNGPLEIESKALNSTTLEMTGISSTHEGVTGQVKFTAHTKIINSGGKTSVQGKRIAVKGANEVTILISIATNFTDYQNLTTDETKKCVYFLNNAAKKNYATLLETNTKAYQNYFNRVHFNLGSSPASTYPTDERVKNFSQNYDPELVVLYFQFGRYLLISSSQPGGQPANLQGIWNDQVRPAWDSKYTININTEMNYWPAEKCNLTELHEPLIQMIKELSITGKETAQTMYGCNGWVVHHNTDIWRISGVVDGAFWGMWPMGSAWLSQHLWEKYLYSGNKEYLESIYPVLKSACKFYQDFLIEEPKNNWLVVSPSISPENAPQGHNTSLSAGVTMDNQLLFDLFSKTIEAAKILKIDSDTMADFRKILDRLPPMQIGQYGQLQEWIDDLDSPNDKHRHVSHLYGLYPGNQISAYNSPELFDAARTSLIHRGDISTGWSMGWKVNLWARLLDGNHAFKLITDQLTLVDTVGFGQQGGTYPNLFDAHPPFQIDGNFGCTSGISEMLMQSHDGAIHILPALPDNWRREGEITGLRANGGFEVSISWEDGKIIKLEIKSNLGGNCRIRIPNDLVLNDNPEMVTANGSNSNPFYATPLIKAPLIAEGVQLNNVVVEETYLYDFSTQAGKTYILTKK